MKAVLQIATGIILLGIVIFTITACGTAGQYNDQYWQQLSKQVK